MVIVDERGLEHAITTFATQERQTLKDFKRHMSFTPKSVHRHRAATRHKKRNEKPGGRQNRSHSPKKSYP